MLNSSQNQDQTQDPQNVTGDGQLPVGGDGTTISLTTAQLEQRLERERQKITRQYGDYDDLKAAKTELDRLRQEQMSELEKAQTAAAEAAKKVADAEAAQQLAEQMAQNTLIKAAIMAAAAGANVANVEDAYLLADLSGVSIDDDGKVAGATEAVKALVDVGRLPLRDGPRAPSLDGGAGGGDRTKEGAAKLTQEELIVAAKMGLTPEQYAEHKQKK